VIGSVTAFCGSSDAVDPKYFWYPAPDVDSLLRYLEGYESHRYGFKWTR